MGLISSNLAEIFPFLRASLILGALGILVFSLRSAFGQATLLGLDLDPCLSIAKRNTSLLSGFFNHCTN